MVNLIFDEKEVLDSFRKMKLMYDHTRFKLRNIQVEDLIKDYEELKKLREEIQVKYFSIYEDLLADDLIEGELDASLWGITREHENETWDAELRLMSEIKTNFDIAINLIESGEAEQVIIDAENWLFVNENILEFDLGRCSGYYVFDVEGIKINREWKYSHTLLDSISNYIVADVIYDNDDETTVEKFLRESTANKNKIAITTDLDKKYIQLSKN